MERIKQLEVLLQSERSKIEALEADSNKLFETEEAFVKVREENETLKSDIESLKKTLQSDQLTGKGLITVNNIYRFLQLFLFIRGNK